MVVHCSHKILFSPQEHDRNIVWSQGQLTTEPKGWIEFRMSEGFHKRLAITGFQWISLKGKNSTERKSGRPMSDCW